MPHLTRFVKALPLVLALTVLPPNAGQAEPLTASDLRQRIAAHVREAVPHQPDDRIEVDVMAIPFSAVPRKQADAPDPETRWAIHSTLAERFAERAIVRLTREDAATGQRHEFGIPVRIHVIRPVWVARRAIQAQSSLANGDFMLESKDVSAKIGTVIDPNANDGVPLSAYKARVSIRKGDVLDSRQVARIPDITRSGDVRIVLTNQQGMAISVIGQALEDGLIGDTIRVRYHSPSSTRPKDYQARVVGRNRVVVEI